MFQNENNKDDDLAYFQNLIKKHNKEYKINIIVYFFFYIKNI